jgi:WD40 repeat protein
VVLGARTKKILWASLVSVCLSAVVACKAEAQTSWIQMLTTGTKVWPITCDGCSWHKSFHQETILEQPWTVSSVVWSSDGRYLSVGSAGEGIINIYDTKNWKLVSDIWRWGGGGFQPLTRFSDQNTMLILPRIWDHNANVNAPTIDDNVSFEKWDIEHNLIAKKYYAHFQNENDHTLDWRRAASIAKAVAVSQDSKLIAVTVQGGGSRVLIYDAASGHVVQEIQCQPRNVPEALAFSPDSHDIVIGGCYLYKVSIYNVRTGNMKFQTVVDYGSYLYNAISYNSNGTLIAVGSSSGDHGTVTILKASDGSVLGVLPNSPPAPFSMGGEHATITNLQWIDNNLILASYDAWNPEGSVARVWDTTSLKLVGGFRGNHLQLTAIGPDRSRLAAVFEKNVVIGDLK